MKLYNRLCVYHISTPNQYDIFSQAVFAGHNRAEGYDRIQTVSSLPAHKKHFQLLLFIYELVWAQLC